MNYLVASLLFASLLTCVSPADGAEPPENWTHKELAAHLEKKGVRVTVEAAPVLNMDGRTAAVFIADGKGQVTVFLCRDAKQAKEQAGAMGGKAFSYGRFAIGVIRGDAADAKFLDQVIAALSP